MRTQNFRIPEGLDHFDATSLFDQKHANARDELVNILEAHRASFEQDGTFDPEKLGFTPHEEGSYGRTYISPCRRFVIRISLKNDDEAHSVYTALALKHQRNPFFPKVYAHLTCGNRSLVLMEKLKTLADAMGDYCEDDYRFVSELRDRMNMGLRIPQNKRNRHPAGYAQWLEAVLNMGEYHDLMADISAQNVMVRIDHRGNRQHVITDPFV